jgi:nicotinamide-nucleotide amidase
VRVAELVALLVARGETLAVAESLTGGLLAATLVEVPGVSRVLRGGLVVYATDLKTSLAGVPADLLAARGPVDPDVARALAAGARARCGADWGLGTTGVAGPDPQDGVPVGTVYVAIAPPGIVVAPPGVATAPPDVATAPPDSVRHPVPPADVRSLVLAGDRAAVRAGAVTAALDLLAEWLTARS